MCTGWVIYIARKQTCTNVKTINNSKENGRVLLLKITLVRVVRIETSVVVGVAVAPLLRHQTEKA